MILASAFAAACKKFLRHVERAPVFCDKIRGGIKGWLEVFFNQLAHTSAHSECCDHHGYMEDGALQVRAVWVLQEAAGSARLAPILSRRFPTVEQLVKLHASPLYVPVPYDQSFGNFPIILLFACYCAVEVLM